MSHTDKDVPYHVREREGEVHHDHRLGYCTLDHPAVVGWRERAKHREVCAKRVTVSNVCTKDEPHRDWFGGRACWTNVFVYVRNEAGVATRVERVWHQCTAKVRERIETDYSIPCECDSWVDEMCYRVPKRRSTCRDNCCVPDKAATRRARYSARREIAEGLAEYLHGWEPEDPCGPVDCEALEHA